MKIRAACAVILGSVFLLGFAVLAGQEFPGPAIAPGLASAGAVLWKGRTTEVLLQGLIILAGVLSILLLLGSGKRGGNS
ncbi:MAG: hypothetical protein LUQ25_00490 [Methanoregulaceae archaeon]|nr:hypothetical protein [Methanoregulaceae archaeon]